MLTPALLTTASTRLKVFIVSSTMETQFSASLMSRQIGKISPANFSASFASCPKRSTLISTAAMEQPTPASAKAMERPRPLPAPVMITTLSKSKAPFIGYTPYRNVSNLQNVSQIKT